jgi:putative membrane protein
MLTFDLLRGLHILAVIAWMSGLLYLPRLYLYHTRAAIGSEADATFKVMEARLLRMIMNPAMVAVVILAGALLWWDGARRLGWGFLLTPWMGVKFAGGACLIAWQHYLSMARKAFAEGRRLRSERFWRLTNEAPFLIAIVVVLAATTKFGG